MTEEEKKAIGQCNLLLNGEITLHIIDDDGGTAYYGVVNKDYNKDLEIVLNLIQKQDKIIKNQSYTNKKMKKKLDNYRKLTKLKERTIQKQDTEINKLNNVIDDLCNDISKHWVENPNEIKQRYLNKSI